MPSLSSNYIAVVGALVLSATHVRAQAPSGADRLEPSAAAESLKVLKELDRAVMRNGDSAALWHRRGMIAWTLWERSRHNPKVRGLDWTSLSPKADESLRRALDLEPSNDDYFVDLARLLLSKGVSFLPHRGGYGVFTEQVEKARESGDPARLAKTANEAARFYWLRWDQHSCLSRKDSRANATTLPSRATELSGGPFTVTRDYAGEIDYLRSEMLIREAREAAPTDTLIFRRFVTLLADHQRWMEVAALSRSQIDRVPGDPWAWMSLGMATHRLGDNRMAIAAFDTALMRFEPSERRRLDRFERVLGTGDRRRWDSLAAQQRGETELFYWRNSDPVWSVQGNEPRIEFLARLTFAELRWTAEELSLNGVNSDLGNTFIRTHGVDPSAGCVPMRAAWYYAGDTTVLNGVPARWTNVLRGLRLDTIPTQIARFRASRDSTDVFLASLAPIEAIRGATDVRGPARVDLWVLAGGTSEVLHDSATVERSALRAATHRVAPGNYVYRAEASAAGSRVAGRSTAGFVAGNDPRTGFSTSGFGMSDVLVATQIESRAAAPSRWRDFNMQALAGPIRRGGSLSLLWENYEFANDSGAAHYGVTITLRRVAAPPRAVARGGRIVNIAEPTISANILTRITNAIGITRTTEHVQFEFERTVPHAPILVDNIELGLRDTPAGTYLLSLQVTDRATGRTLGRSQRIVIAEPPRR